MWRSPVARTVRVREAPGSNPGIPTLDQMNLLHLTLDNNFLEKPQKLLFGMLFFVCSGAWRSPVARFNGVEEVVSSNLAAPTYKAQQTPRIKTWRFLFLEQA